LIELLHRGKKAATALQLLERTRHRIVSGKRPTNTRLLIRA
jgi:hypothetical protein